MKRIIALLCLVASSVFAGSAVQVDTNGIVTFPTNFFTVNGVSTTSTVSSLDVRLTDLESTFLSTSNSLSARIDAATNDIQVLSTNVAVISTNYATKAEGIAATNALAIASGLQASTIPYTNGNIYVTGTVYAAGFSGDGSGLTGLVASVTNAVTGIQFGTSGSNYTGNVVVDGMGFSYTGPGTVKVTRVDYFCRNVAITTNIFEITGEAPRDEAITLTKIFAKCDDYNATFDVFMQPSNSLWRADQTTLIAGVVALATGTAITTNIVIPAGYEWGVKMTDFDPRTTQMRVSYKIEY